MDAFSFNHRGGRAQILDSRIRARAQEDGIDLDVSQRRAGLKIHIGQSLLRCGLKVLITNILWVWHICAQWQALARVGAPGDKWGQLGSIDFHDRIKMRALIGRKGLPIGHGGFPVLALWGKLAVTHILKSGLVRSDHSRTRARLDRHIADGHPRFHRHVANRLAAILNDVALAAAGTNLGNDGQNQVLRAHAFRQVAVYLYSHGFEWL